MLLWTVRTMIISIVLIMIIHNLVCFFTKMLTVPKLKDLVYAPTYKYDKMYNTIMSSSGQHHNYLIKNNSGSNNGGSDNRGSNSSNSGNNDNTTNIESLYVPQSSSTSNINDLAISSSQPNNMKNELKNFLKKQLKNTPSSTIDLSSSSSSSLNNSSQYSEY